MIISFIIVVLSLLLIFSAAIVFALSKKNSEKTFNKKRRNELNHELYDIRLKEVEGDVEQGVVLDKESMIVELQYNLLDDIDDEDVPNKQNKQRRIWLPGVLFLILSSITLYWYLGAFKEVSHWQNTLKRYPEIHQNLFKQPYVTPDQQTLKDLMLGLRTHLSNEPSDAQGWILYSRLGRIFQDQALAVDALKKALQSEPDNAQIELEYIELKMKVGDQYSQAIAQSRLAKFLQKYPNNSDAWSMYGLMALQQENFQEAIIRWQKALNLVDPNSNNATMLNNSILYAKEQFTLQAATELSDREAVFDRNDMRDAEANEAVYEVNISISEQVIYPPNSFLFIYAQSIKGAAMPIAAIKLPTSHFPIKVTLSDENAMMEGVKLSDYDAFIIKARISRDGSVNKMAGQWGGKSAIIKAGAVDPIYIEINEQL